MGTQTKTLTEKKHYRKSVEYIQDSLRLAEVVKIGTRASERSVNYLRLTILLTKYFLIKYLLKTTDNNDINPFSFQGTNQLLYPVEVSVVTMAT